MTTRIRYKNVICVNQTMIIKFFLRSSSAINPDDIEAMEFYSAKYNILLIRYLVFAYFNTIQNHRREKKCVLSTDSNAVPFTSKILKKINRASPQVASSTVSRYTRAVARSLRKQPEAYTSASPLVVYEPCRLPRRARAKCIRCSQFAAMVTIPYKQNASCAHDIPRLSLSRRCPPAARLVATEGTVAGVKKCHRTGRDTTVNSERVSEGTAAAPVCFAR